MLAGCLGKPVATEQVVQTSGNVGRFERHPQYKAAVLAAPDLMLDVDETMIDLEAQIKALRTPK